MAQPLPEPGSVAASDVVASDLLHSRVETYPWTSDVDFQSGLASILGTNPASDQDQAEDLALRARCFYYARKFNVEVDHDAYKRWRSSRPSFFVAPIIPPSPSQTFANAASEGCQSTALLSHLTNGSYSATPVATSHAGVQESSRTEPPASFDEIMHLIQTGQPIPGIKHIPDTVLFGQGTEATRSRRQKPWEKSTHGLTDTINPFTAEAPR